ncbi:type I restriction endonuclease subunit R [Haloquadratum walsbyi]|uniref:type I site-specific deoxyribonuclease n=1 Tax=Haloquadratum walsbyi (strain DSM 16854 / JCM 12705 / C23) TaxID=768065 RepID=G0LND7_HALWC|nr:type I restriction endonuclease subunit R [Haloquadratum walsbyi]CCC41943.1 type I site-specific deoxyribonuclease subunit RmeR [Haloquadratum walsbyi C23]
MVSIPSEQGVERSYLSWLDGLGWEVHGQDGSRGANVLDVEYERRSNEVIYWNLLAEQLIVINDSLTEDNVEKFVSSLRRDLDAENLMDGNEAFYELLTKGKTFSVKQNGSASRTVYIDLIDYENPENNRFHAVNQFSVSRETTIRPDVNLLVNGIPLVTMELKSVAQDNDWHNAVSDLQAYEDDVPRLFVPTLFNVAADTMEFRYGAVGASKEFYEPWNDAPEQYTDDGDAKQAIQALCNPQTILDILKNFVFYERRAGGNAKIIPRHMQYYAVNRMLERVDRDEHDRGLIWHTQGSGKSFTMLYAAENLLERAVARNPQVFIIVDTDKLNSQMRDQLANLSLGAWTEAESIDHLQELIEQGQSELILTTIQKFQDVDPDSQGNDEVIVMSDEAHRFMEADLGSRLDAALPSCTHFGFTGTPVREGEQHKDRNTFREFSPEGEDYIHRYSVKQGIDDELILPVYFTLRHEMEWQIDESGLDEEFERQFRGLSSDEKRELIRDNVTARMLAEIEPRVQKAVEEIDQHYEESVSPNNWKGMVVTPSRRSAAMYGERLVERRGKDEVEVLYTSNKDDPDLIQQFHTDSEERDSIVNEFKDEDNPKLLIVHNMLLTGFDAPILKTIYLDRNLKNHNLMQAIARTNRPASGKENGEIVDFQGVFENIDEALDYDTETQSYAARDKDELFDDLVDQLETVIDIFEGIPKTDTQEATSDAVEQVLTHPTRREFKQGFRRLQDLYEAVAPDSRLVEKDIERRYKWLSRIHVAFRRTTSGEDDPEEDMREKTREIVSENVAIDTVKRDFPTYKLGEDVLEEVDEIDNPSVKASQIAHATQEHLNPRENQNPRYKRLSERVTDVVERWQGGDIADPDAVEALQSVEEEILEVEEEAEEQGMTDSEFAIYTHLTEETPEAIESDEQAEAVANEIIEQFYDRVDHGFAGWQTNQQTIAEIERILLDVLVVEYDLGDLIDDEFVDTVREYLIQNHEATVDHYE